MRNRDKRLPELCAKIAGGFRVRVASEIQEHKINTHQNTMKPPNGQPLEELTEKSSQSRDSLLETYKVLDCHL